MKNGLKIYGKRATTSLSYQLPDCHLVSLIFFVLLQTHSHNTFVIFRQQKSEYERKNVTEKFASNALTKRFENFIGISPF